MANEPYLINLNKWEVEQALWMPGDAGNNLTATWVNKLDADTAHIEQGLGTWVSKGGSTVTQSSDYAYFGSNSVKLVSGAGVTDGGMVTGFYTASAAVEYTASARVYVGSAQPAATLEIVIEWYNSSDVLISSSGGTLAAVSDDTWQTIFVTATSPANTAKVKIVLDLDSDAENSTYYVDAITFREGNLVSFVPSLDISGVTDVNIDYKLNTTAPSYTLSPSVTVGEGWQGALLTFEVRDGTDGPVVFSIDLTDSASTGTSWYNSEGYLINLNTSGSAIARFITGDSWVSDGTEYILLASRPELTGVEWWKDGVQVADPNFLFVGSAGTPNAGKGGWWAAFSSAATQQQQDDIAAWDGTVENEPSWIRTDPVFYINADDTDLARQYEYNYKIINLAAVTPTTLYVRENLSTTDTAVTPSVDNLYVEVYPPVQSVSDSANEHDGSTVGGAKLSQPPALFEGNSLYFDGINDKVEVPIGSELQFSGTASFSVECWFKDVNSTVANPRLISTEYAGIEGWGLLLATTTDKVVFIRWQANAQDNASQTGTYTVNKWTHVVVTYDGTSIVIYVNGAQDGTLLSSKSIASGATKLVIGDWNDASGTRLFNGYIDEPAVYSRVLTPEEIAQHYQVGWEGKFSKTIGDTGITAATESGYDLYSYPGQILGA